jgi:hypothetical protein
MRSSGPCESCWVRFVVCAWKKLVVICPTSVPTSYQMTSIEPTNSMLIHAIIFWHAQMMIINGFELIIWPMWVMLGQICGQGSTKIGFDFSNFEPSYYQMTSIEPTNSMLIHDHPFHHLLTCSDDDNEWFWIDYHLWPMWVMLGQICGQGSPKIGFDFSNFEPSYYQMTSIEPTNSMLIHDHPCHHLLTFSDDDNEWLWWGHLAHMSHAGSDLWSGLNKNWLWFAQLPTHCPTRWHP